MEIKISMQEAENLIYGKQNFMLLWLKYHKPVELNQKLTLLVQSNLKPTGAIIYATVKFIHQGMPPDFNTFYQAFSVGIDRVKKLKISSSIYFND